MIIIKEIIISLIIVKEILITDISCPSFVVSESAADREIIIVKEIIILTDT